MLLGKMVVAFGVLFQMDVGSALIIPNQISEGKVITLTHNSAYVKQETISSSVTNMTTDLCQQATKILLWVSRFCGFVKL